MKNFRAVVAALFMSMMATPVIAQAKVDQSQQGDGAALFATVDAKIKAILAKKQIPGAVVAVVQTGKPTLYRGYGFADIKTQRPMDPQKTRVRVGSISKSFTALAFLQLVDEGKVRLNEDANRFLKTERIPARYGQPITVLNLLTHRAGFDGDITNVFVNQGLSPAIKQGWISRQMLRVNPPERFAYDNTAYLTLGQILADQDGMSYEETVKRRVYDRIGMAGAMMGVDPTWPDTPSCYQRIRRQFMPCPHQILKNTYGAAGNMSATAADMALYLQELINGGGSLLKPATFQAFSSTTHRISPDVTGDGLGIYEMGPKGSGVFGHSGGIRGGSSLYFVIPSKGIGLFVHINSSDGLDNRFNLSGMVSRAMASTSSNDDFDPGDLMSFQLPAELAARFGNTPAPATGNANCDETALPGHYQYSRALGFAALAPRFLGRIALEPFDVIKGKGDQWTIDGKPYRRAANCFFASTGKSYLDGEIAGTVGFSQLPDGTIMGGAHTLAGWTKLKWYESASVTALPFLLTLLLIPFGLIAAIGAHPKPKRALRLIGVSGIVLFGCILLEMEYASALIQDQGRLFPAVLWRIGWHVALIGLALGTVGAARALTDTATGLLRKIVLVAFMISTIIAIILSGYWGLIGTFTGNNFS